MPKTATTAETATPAKETLPVAIEAVLKRFSKGLNTNQILEKLTERGGAQPTGKTPAATVQAILSTSNAKGGKFVKLSRGVYAVRKAAAVAA